MRVWRNSQNRQKFPDFSRYSRLFVQNSLVFRIFPAGFDEPRKLLGIYRGKEGAKIMRVWKNSQNRQQFPDFSKFSRFSPT